MNISDSHLFNKYNEELFSTMDYYLNDYWIEECDPRTKDYLFFRGGPQQMLLFMSIWLLFVTKIGPNLMSNREGFQLRNIMLIYNIFMVVSNAYFFILSIRWLNYGKRLFEFEFPSSNDRSIETMIVIDQTIIYLYTKFIDLLDTIFFVLRKKYSQITFLHLYHHFMVPVLGWFTIKLAPTVQPLAVFAILNTLVHVVMYSYYALAAFGPTIQKYLWWKKYITILQLIQFGLLITYGVFNAYFTSGWPLGLYWIGWAQNPIFFYLFFEFYRQSYNQSKNKKVY